MGELFIFKCNLCGCTFEMFHMALEPVPEVLCPECGGKEATRIESCEHKGALPCKKRPKTDGSDSDE